MTRKIIIIIGVSFLICLFSFAQNKKFILQHFDIVKEMSHNQVNPFYQSNRGFIYVDIIHIMDNPFWWKTWWFKLMTLAILILSILIAYFIRLQLFRSKQNELTALVGKRTKEISEANEILLERQNRIEEYSEELRKYAENLREANDLLVSNQRLIRMQTEELKEANDLLMDKQILIEMQNEALKKANGQTEKQLKSISGKAAHRINNQVTNYDAIELELQNQIELDLSDKFVLKEILDRLVVTTRNLKKMISEFKNFGKPITISKELCNINVILRNEIQLAKFQGMTIELKSEDNLPMITLDIGRFAEAIKELLINSKKAISKTLSSSEVGKITISTGLIDENGSKHVVIDVLDNGSGFSKDFPVFEPFQSTDPQGTGLGLATVKELIDAHGGLIEAFNETTGGAHIRITLSV